MPVTACAHHLTRDPCASTLAVELQVGQWLEFRHASGENVRVMLEAKSGRRAARLKVEAHQQVKIVFPGKC